MYGTCMYTVTPYIIKCVVYIGVNKIGYRDFKAFNFKMSSQIIVFLDMSRQPY